MAAEQKDPQGKVGFHIPLVKLVHFVLHQMQTDMCDADTWGFYKVLLCKALIQSGILINVFWQQGEHHQTIISDEDADVAHSKRTISHQYKRFLENDATSI